MKIERVILGGLLVALVGVGVGAYYNSQIIGLYQDKLQDVSLLKQDIEAYYKNYSIADENVPMADSSGMQTLDFESRYEELDEEINQ